MTKDYIQVCDGTNANPKVLKWKIDDMPRPSELMENFAEVSQELLAIDPREKSTAKPGGIFIQVDQYKREWLQWKCGTSEAEFMRNIFYRIDHPRINIYPVNWVSTASSKPGQVAD